MKLLSIFALCARAAIKVPDGLSELSFIECGENGPYDHAAPKVHTLAKVKKVSVTDCSWVGTTCGLVRGQINSIFIEYTMDNVNDKFNGKQVKKFPKKQETKDGGPLATVDVCGHIPGIMKHLCAPFSLPNVDVCTQGLDCSIKGSRMPKDNSETRVIKVEVPVNEAYPTVKVLAKWEITDQTSKKQPKLFCVYIPLAVL